MNEQYINRIQLFREKLNQSSLDGAFVQGVNNIRYLSALNNDHANVVFLLITLNDLFLVTDYRYAEQAENECPLYKVVVRNRQKVSLAEQFKRLADQNNIKRLGFESDYISYTMYQALSEAMTTTSLIPYYGWVEQQRMIKNETELQYIRKAATIADDSFADLIQFMKPGMTERDAALELEYQMQKRGSQGMSFETILISGVRSSLPHGLPTDKLMQPGDLITLDFGAVVNGYRSDMTRALIIGEPSAQQLDVFETVKTAQQVGIEAVTAGITGNIPFFETQKILDASEFSQYKGEGLGHGVGLDLHEQPFLTAHCEITLKSNMIITIEPGIYIPGWGGVRIEDDVCVTENGCEVLTHAPKELISIT